MPKKKITKEDFARGMRKVGMVLGGTAVLTGAVATGVGVKNQRDAKQAAEKAKTEQAKLESYREEFMDAYDLVLENNSIKYENALKMAEDEADKYQGHVDILQERMILEYEHEEAKQGLHDKYVQKIVAAAKALGGKPNETQIDSALNSYNFYNPEEHDAWIGEGSAMRATYSYYNNPGKYTSGLILDNIVRDIFHDQFKATLPFCGVKDTASMDKKLKTLATSYFNEFSALKAKVERENVSTVKALEKELEKATLILTDKQQALENIREQVSERQRNNNVNREQEYDWVKKQTDIREIKKRTQELKGTRRYR